MTPTISAAVRSWPQSMPTPCSAACCPILCCPAHQGSRPTIARDSKPHVAIVRHYLILAAGSPGVPPLSAVPSKASQTSPPRKIIIDILNPVSILSYTVILWSVISAAHRRSSPCGQHPYAIATARLGPRHSSEYGDGLYPSSLIPPLIATRRCVVGHCPLGVVEDLTNT